MRYVVGCTLLLVMLLAAFPGTGSAQSSEGASVADDVQEEARSESNTGEATPPSEHDERTLSPRLRDRTRRKWDPNTYELRLDSSGVGVASPSPSPLREDPRLVKHRQGMIISSVAFGLGIAALAGGIVLAHNAEAPPDEWIYIPIGPIILASFGAATALGGLVGLAISSSRFSQRKRELRSWASRESGKRRRIQFDPRTSGFVF